MGRIEETRCGEDAAEELGVSRPWELAAYSVFIERRLEGLLVVLAFRGWNAPFSD
jgi:hypothetical protein